VYLIKNDRRKERLLVVMWSLASWLFVVSHREFFGYHYLLLLPPFAILTGYGLAEALGPRLSIRQTLTGEWGKAFIIFALLANIGFFVTLNYMHYTKSYYYLTKKISQEEYYAFFRAYPKHDYSFPADYQASQYLARHTEPDDTIYVLGGTDSVIFFLAQRKPSSRFIFSWFLFSYAHSQVKQAEAYREELLADLQKKTPRYIVTIRALDTFRRFSRIYQFIQDNYVLDKIFPDDRFVFVRK
jgi:hypothetical protein